MQDFTTHETSLKLKEAGFPQPPHEFGQVWWLERANGEVYPDVLPLGFEFDPAQNPVFAPRVTDILKQMVDPFSDKDNPESPVLIFSHINEEFVIFRGGKTRKPHKNPAECAAMLYLQNKK